MTPTQIDTAAMILTLTRQHGYPPTVRELGRAMGIGSTRGAMENVARASDAGLVRIDAGRARGATVRACGCSSPLAFRPVRHQRGMAVLSRAAVCLRCRGIVLATENAQ